MPRGLTQRGRTEIAHRIQSAWFKFGKHARVLTNNNISIKLRLKLFDIAISPALLFGLSALPVHEDSYNKIDIVQRKMLREIVGWVRYESEGWDITMHRMNDRLCQALCQYKVCPWSERIQVMKQKMVSRIEGLPHDRWESLSSKWLPSLVHDDSQEWHAFRERGRPPLRWNDGT